MPNTEKTMEPNLQGPLRGRRVLELGSMAAGPFIGRLFGEFGADVIKVEQAEGDPIRNYGKRLDGKSLYSSSIMRNKRNISLDLRTTEGQDLVRRMLPRCDFVIENFRPGTLERWGLGYEAMRRIHPGIIMIRVSGFGQDGPYSKRAGYGVVAEAVSGLRHITGDEDRPPSRVAIPLTDYIGGLYGAFGALAALDHRERTGVGQVVDVALYEGAFSFTEPFVPEFDKLKQVGMRAGPRLPDNAPNSLFLARDGLYVQITAGNDNVFRRLAETMGRPELVEDPRFSTPTGRWQNVDALEAEMGAWSATLDAADIEARLNANGVPSARIYTMAEVFDDPHFKARDMLVTVPSDELGSVTLAGIVPKLSETPGAVRWAGRTRGRDTREVLTELCDMDDDEYARLEAEGIVAGSNGGRSSAAAE
jgi:crotonobetainyl-CoA:carnitine CoA-transferase CaiB-like acyl-CoA transferase